MASRNPNDILGPSASSIGRVVPSAPMQRGPSSEELLAALLRFGRLLFVEQSEEESAGHLLSILRDLFPGRYFLLRLVDLRGEGRVRAYGDVARARSGIDSGRIRIRQRALDKIQLKTAVAASALLQVEERWDSPFTGVACGFAVPLAISGEFYGLLDLGYPLGTDDSELDEDSVLPLANQMAAALRNERLYHDTKSLRDYQSRLIEHASALILGIDSNWRIRVCNMALCNLLGKPSAELIGRDLRHEFPVVDRNHLIQVFGEGMRGSDSALGESQVISGNGRHVPVAWRVAPIRSRGSVQAVVAIGQDQSVLSDLQKQLVQAEKLSTLGQIAAGVVHELNNPLTAIGVYSDYLLKRAEKRAAGGDAADLEDLEKLRTIRDGAERIKLFTRDLMQYARPSAGVPERLSINRVINQSLSFCEHLFSESGVVLERDLDDNIPDVHAVPGQLEQVVINLVTNAVQASGDSGAVEVRSFHESEGNRVVFCIKDQGPGISAEDQERIFEPFFTTKTGGEGTGLGLCIVRNILEENNGELILKSTLGTGTEFRCLVPAYADEQ